MQYRIWGIVAAWPTDTARGLAWGKNGNWQSDWIPTGLL